MLYRLQCPDSQKYGKINKIILKFSFVTCSVNFSLKRIIEKSLQKYKNVVYKNNKNIDFSKLSKIKIIYTSIQTR